MCDFFFFLIVSIIPRNLLVSLFAFFRVRISPCIKIADGKPLIHTFLVASLLLATLNFLFEPGPTCHHRDFLATS